MDFGFSQEQELLRATARKFFENECASTFVRERMAEPAGVTDDFWTKLAEQGWGRRAIASRLKVSPHAVRRVLEGRATA